MQARRSCLRLRCAFLVGGFGVWLVFGRGYVVVGLDSVLRDVVYGGRFCIRGDGGIWMYLVPMSYEYLAFSLLEFEG